MGPPDHRDLRGQKTGLPHRSESAVLKARPSSSPISARAISVDNTFDFVAVSANGRARVSSGAVKLIKGHRQHPSRDATVILVEDSSTPAHPQLSARPSCSSTSPLAQDRHLSGQAQPPPVPSRPTTSGSRSPKRVRHRLRNGLSPKIYRNSPTIRLFPPTPPTEGVKLHKNTSGNTRNRSLSRRICSLFSRACRSSPPKQCSQSHSPLLPHNSRHTEAQHPSSSHLQDRVHIALVHQRHPGIDKRGETERTGPACSPAPAASLDSDTPRPVLQPQKRHRVGFCAMVRRSSHPSPGSNVPTSASIPSAGFPWPLALEGLAASIPRVGLSKP